MAEGIAKSLGHDAASAGTHPAREVSKNALTVLHNMGIDTTGMKPKNLDLFSPEDFDLVISINTLHCLEAPDLFLALKEMERVGKNYKYLCVESYRNEVEKANLLLSV